MKLIHTVTATVVSVLLLIAAAPVHAEDFKKAAESELRSAVKSNLQAAIVLASRQVEGNIAELDQPFIRKTFERGAAAGIPAAQSGLANCHMNGIGGPIDSAPILDLVTKAAAKDDPFGCYLLGVMLCYEEHGAERDIEKGIALLKKSSELGYLNADVLLARRVSNGYRMVQRHIPESIAMLKELAEKKQSARAAMYVGLHYHIGVGKDQKLAKHYYTMAAAGNDAAAMVRLGDMLVSSDKTQPLPIRLEAADWYRKAVARNSAFGMRQLGKFQMRQTDVRKDGENWYEMLKKASDLGDETATYTLGFVNYHAAGYTFRDLDWTKSAHYFQRFYDEARELDPAYTLKNLCEIYYKGGFGLDRSFTKCFDVAATHVGQFKMAPYYLGLVLLHSTTPMGNTREHFIRGYACMLSHQKLNKSANEDLLFLLRSRHGMTRQEVEQAKKLADSGFPNSQTPILP